jgi:glutamate synthase (NADPH/NADH) large chain/glutamate synthase (ferredoxin)
MTGGIVVVLGETGRNFGAGMSGGRAYVYDASGTFSKRYNSAMVGIERLTHDDEAKKIESLIFAHLEATDSPRASEILKSWATNRGHFWVVVPHPAEAKPAGQPVNEPEKRTSSSSDTTTVSAPKGSF